MLANSCARNLLNARGVFQIDGNLGAAAGIAECLLQSHLALHFLPALPPEWRDGSATGLLARGSREVDMHWHGGQLTQAIVRPTFDGPVEVVGPIMQVCCGSQTVPVSKTVIGFTFTGEAGQVYQLTPAI